MSIVNMPRHVFTFFARFAPARGPRDRLERLLRAGDLEGALAQAEALEAAAHSDAERAYAVNKRGVVLLRLGRRDDAETAFRAVLQLQPRNAPALTNLGNLALESGDTARALERYDEAIKADVEYPNAYYNKAIALKRLGRLAEAVAARKEASWMEGRLRRRQRKQL